jgi:hypothetical protein
MKIDADVVKQREERRDEDNGGQNLEGKDGARVGRQKIAEGSGVGKAELAEQDSGAGEGGREHVVDYAAGPGHRALSVVEAQHQKGKRDLQAESPGDGAPADAFAISRAEPGCQQHGQNSQHSDVSIQEVAP